VNPRREKKERGRFIEGGNGEIGQNSPGRQLMDQAQTARAAVVACRPSPLELPGLIL